MLWREREENLPSRQQLSAVFHISCSAVHRSAQIFMMSFADDESAFDPNDGAPLALSKCGGK
jgi:hypothetical protein